MMVSEWELFPPNVYANDMAHPIMVCSGVAGCGCLVANTFDGRLKHVRFHNEGRPQ